ncbi:MAG: hypothetical protein AB7S70_09920 [Hyphomicrobium sp.]|uniref:hypothetical protein n=1 Tax=Hyphomicrobium sp. TaxID=82 RepID=UPI003D143512
MRRVERPGSLLAEVSAAAILVSLSASIALADGGAPAPSATQAAAADDDYYTRRAKRILAREKAAEIKPHPLAALYPDYDVVVCEGGCLDRRGAAVVYARQSAPVREARESYVVPTSSDGDAASLDARIPCIGGCYGDTETDPVPPPMARAKAPARTVQSKDLPPRDKLLSPIR